MTEEKVLKPWREVITPHADVSGGRFRQAEFAADLAQVIAGKATSEYQDPIEFFKRTYLTAGMTRLLAVALQRVSGEAIQPVIKVQTAFGGGKTHSMMAIYHLLNGKAVVNQLEGIQGILTNAGTKKLPKASFAILVGSDLDPSKGKSYGKTKVNTLWGQIAYQIGGSDAYEIVRTSDEKGVSPGSDTLIEILDKFGPCVILIDEMVTYMRNIYGVEGLPSGSFDSNISFIHSLTEAVKRSKASLLVASIPESDIEIGGTAGKAVLERIEAIFNRIEEAWEPIQPKESFEIVRRRLFAEIIDEKARNDTCKAYGKLYSSNASCFPVESKEEPYLERMRAAYPIHPEVFDRLYDDWAAMDRFQKTRGVLRLMAATIHELWVKGDNSLMIMPGSLPLDSSKVKNEILRYLPDVWNSIIDKDIDGDRSEPFKIDEENPRFGTRTAARRVARTIFLGSAPSVSAQRVRGIENVRIRLGIVQPGEQVALFDDALGKLLDRLTHLYTDASNQRYWFDTQPGLGRTVRDRAGRLDFADVRLEIERRLKAVRERGDFHAVHISPSSSDVPDEQEVRLIVLPITATHKSGRTDSQAIQQASSILENRGESPRHFKNMIVFLAPDMELAPALELDVRQYLAWSSVIEDADSLNLDGYQRRQAAHNKERINEGVDFRLKETYGWLLVPSQEGTGPITWTISKVSASEGSFVSSVSKKLRIDQLLLTKWSPALLKMELDRWVWRNQEHIGVQKLWEYMCKYPYLTRLKDSEVLLQTIRDGVSVASRDYFGYATGIGEKNHYLGLKIGSDPGNIYLDSSSVLVKPEAAIAQIPQEAESPNFEEKGRPVHAPEAAPLQLSLDTPLESATRFYGTVELDPTRLGRDAGKIAEEIVQHLQSILGSKVEITLEINANLPGGIPENIQRTIMENCKTLKFKQFNLEEK
ncbi:MAG: DUF499 domain-containing protein [archaeon]|nr:DUF499 domain-containing protein [archaeon]